MPFAWPVVPEAWYRVLGSTVNAELEGNLGAAIAIERAIKSETQKSELVRTWR